MAIDRQSIDILDPGLNVVAQSDTTFLFVGCAEKGPLNTVVAFGSPKRVFEVYGQGPLSEDLCTTLMLAGGPVYGCRVAATSAGTSGAVNKVAFAASSGTVTVSGVPFDRYQAIVEITRTGTLGAGRFRYSLDVKAVSGLVDQRPDGRTYSEEITIPGSGTFEIPRTGVVLTFAPGGGPVFFERGDVHTFATTAPHYGSTEVGLACDALQAYFTVTPGAVFDAIVLTGRNATGSGAATLFGALGTRLAGFTQTHRYLGGMMDGGTGDATATAKTAFAAVADARICITYGDIEMQSSKPFAGFGAPRRTALSAIAAMGAAALPSTDLARKANGPVIGVYWISHDEYLNPEMDDAQFSTMRTRSNNSGYFIANARMKSPQGSDFRYWQHRRCMDIACRVTADLQEEFLSDNVATTDLGTIEDSEAKVYESIVQRGLENALLLPKNVKGKPGHVSAIGYSVDRTVDLLRTETMETEVAIRPHGYVKNIVTKIGFAANVG